MANTGGCSKCGHEKKCSTNEPCTRWVRIPEKNRDRLCRCTG